MKKYLIPLFLLFSLFFMLLGCGENPLDNILENYLKNSSSSGNDLSLGLVPNTIIPDDIKSSVEAKMPIHSGTTPPDISGQYIASRMILIGSSLNGDRDTILAGGGHFADLYIVFTEKANKMYYRAKEITQEGEVASGNSDDINVEVVGESNNFTAYFIEEGQTEGIRTKRSVVISGTMTSIGIKDFYYSFISLEKGPDPQNKLVPVKTYRVFKDSDGLAEKYDWF
ncbi:MAG: hypothetical protein LBC64_07810 [Fibromonadaceae bacterium]|nr:hypothetical protein [Fibromonadaceae bacterium]